MLLNPERYFEDLVNDGYFISLLQSDLVVA
jgi:hypothetical protein